MHFMKNNSRGFSLMEILIVTAVIAIMAGVFYVNFEEMKEKANLVKVIALSEEIGMKMVNSLVAEWTFDEGSGSTAYDSSGNEIHGTIVGASYNTDTVFQNGSSLSFTGQDSSYVGLGTKLNSYLPSTPATLEVWVKGSLLGGNQIIFVDFNSRIALGLYSNDSFIVAAGSKGAPIFKPGASWKNNDWNHVVITYDKNFDPNVWTNGKEATKTSTNNNWSGTGEAFIGKRSGGTGLKGLIDEIRIYDRELTFAEIQYRYYAGLNNLLVKNKIDKSEYQKRIIFE